MRHNRGVVALPEHVTDDAARPVRPAELPLAGRASSSPYVDLDRAAWSRLSESTPLPLTDADVHRLRGLGDPIDLAEVDAIYRPLSRLLNLYVTATAGLHQATSTFLREGGPRTPYVIGVAGSVAVGKSTVARILREMMARWPETPHVELVTTDGFLYPNAELQRRGLMERKGFPESYDRRALVRFVSRVKAGQEEVRAPVYSHVTYDIVPGEEVVVRRPDVLIVEGLNVLQPARPGAAEDSTVAVSDFFDFSIFVDARTRNIRQWYVDRFLHLRQTAFSRPESYFHRYADLTDEQATARALSIWEAINAPNLEQNILPTRGRATLVLTKGADHSVQRARLRKL
ncbi:pantothenate kinase [Xylanimonas cellulosilytica DSM 15894]|uniref:Pantothenate kinase n=1 Tax=Xylanimonas cellulosilytica (strain DSM 15894 / JCM 12276 / CECT 5975 / KCTC 9989 / LMG 20990 / NBRC 107835 / XIL07) TaxID=446471 RepID=D1BWX3_XYLCX|nr:pantothenate kinase [Xylanimonas cellulosilytica DSM 15894]